MAVTPTPSAGHHRADRGEHRRAAARDTRPAHAADHRRRRATRQGVLFMRVRIDADFSTKFVTIREQNKLVYHIR